MKNDILTLERIILTGMLTEKTFEYENIKPDFFTDEKHRKIAKGIIELVNNDYDIDFYSVAEFANVDINYLEELLNIPSLYDYEVATKKVINRYKYNEINKTIDEARMSNLTTDEYLYLIQDKIDELNVEDVKDFISLGDTINFLDEDIERAKAIALEGKINGITSGYLNIDKMTGGFDLGDLIVVAGRPSMGKTTFALNMAVNQAMRGIPVLYFSWEMTARQELRNKILARFAKVNSMSIKNGYIKPEQEERIKLAAKKIRTYPLIISEDNSYDPFYYKKIIKRAKKEYGIQVVYFDHIGLTIDGINPVTEISRLSKTFKNIAQKENIVCVGVSQLSRAVEKRENKRPMLSDLRDSGSLEQDSNKVIFLYRDSYYNKSDEFSTEEEADTTEIITAKNRNGAIGTNHLYFNKHYSDFYEI